jgi:hypothetical protein
VNTRSNRPLWLALPTSWVAAAKKSAGESAPPLRKNAVFRLESVVFERPVGDAGDHVERLVERGARAERSGVGEDVVGREQGDDGSGKPDVTWRARGPFARG